MSFRTMESFTVVASALTFQRPPGLRQRIRNYLAGCFTCRIIMTPSPTSRNSGQAFSCRGSEPPLTAHSSSQCGGILPIKGELEGVCGNGN